MRVDTLPELGATKTRIAPRLNSALELIVFQGLSVKDAAIQTGYTPNSLAVALRRPHVIARKRDIVATFLQSGADLCKKTLLEIVRESKSDGARIEAIKAFLTLTGDLGGDKQTSQNINGDVIINYLPAPSRDDLPTITVQPINRNDLKDNSFIDIEPD
jgi:hypothetical protein